MNHINILTNFLSPKFQDTIESAILGNNFPWYFAPKTVSSNEDSPNVLYTDRSKDGFQFTHGFVRENQSNSDYWNLITPVVFGLMSRSDVDVNNVLRVKANLTVPIPDYPENFYKPPHVDFLNDKVVSAIYYVNNSDGDTIFFQNIDYEKEHKEFKETFRFTPQKGTLVFFNAKTLHTAVFPKFNQRRCVINFNFLQE